MRLGELFAFAGLECDAKYRNIEVSGVVTDSRAAYEKCIFVCIDGYNTSGHKYIDEAIQKGAAVIVAEQVRDGCVGGAAIIKIDNTRRAAAMLCNAQCGSPSREMKIVGVTGTNGKTTVCCMLESMFVRAGIPCASIGTLGCRVCGKQSELYSKGLTTPDAVELYPLLAFLRDRGIEWVFMEVSSHALALSRIEAISFEYGIFTNLSRDHLDFHKSMEEYFSAKRSLFERCRRRIVNADDAYGMRLAREYADAVRCSERIGDATACERELLADGMRYTMKYKGNRQIYLNSQADFSVMNSLLAATVAIEQKIPEEAVLGGLSRFCGAPGRMQRVRLDGCPFEVIIDFAHTPDALERLLRSVRDARKDRGRIITVFGCGGDRDRGKRRQMGGIASRLSDVVIVTSDNPRDEDPDKIIDEVLKGIDKEKPHKSITSRKEAIEYAVDMARAGDVVLLCGKGHEKYQITAQGKLPFDEEEIVRSAAVKKNYCNLDDKEKGRS